MYTLKIEQDELLDSPRTWDNIGNMVCFHKRYRLGDNHDYDIDDYDSWDELEKALNREHDIAVALPLYLYDHSGITMNTTGFSCGWDSGQVGFIYVTKEKLRKEFNVKRISKAILQKATDILVGEVSTYDQYLTGDVYWFGVYDESGEMVDSCGGFYGRDPKTNGMADHLPCSLDEVKIEY
jgi:hypothetical protein